MSDAAEVGAVPPAAGWARLERAATAAAASLGEWRRRAVEAEREVERLRGELEAVSAGGGGGPAAAGESGPELRRLRAENALLTSRAAEARQRVVALLARLAVLERRG